MTNPEDQTHDVRVRIAPSPTGDPHVGTAYIALFNYIFAQKHKGSFVLRIEDTDQSRFRSSSEKQILSTLQWLGLNWDEGPDKPGKYGPYRQSERLPIYKQHVDMLLEKGNAYYCFCSSERLDQVRQSQREQGLQTKYDGHCKSLSSDEIKGKLTSNEPYVVRMSTPNEGKAVFFDELRGQIEFDFERIDDQVLLKTDGYPTYHLANVVDDHLMKISHVIRAEEWISSTPKHVLLYQAFDWPQPKWVHMPLLRNSDRSKISKRKNPVSLSYFQRAGILPHAMVNFLALMGWSYGDDQEIFSIDEMIDRFEFKNISLGGPVFDLVKLTWLNQHYMHQMSEDEFVDHIRQEMFNDAYLRKLKPLILERMSRFEQFVDKNAFFFNGSLDYSAVNLIPKGKTASDMRRMITELADLLDDLYDWNTETIEGVLANHKSAIGWKPKDYFMSIRLLVTGRKDSPPLGASLEAIGRDMVRFRLRDALACSQLID